MSRRWLFAVCLVLGTVFALASDTPPPVSVTVAGSLQSELGCAGDWDPGCAATHLAFNPDSAIWSNTFTVPAGNWEYKAALNDSWDENYGLHAQRNGANIPLALAADTAVKFYYDHETHWITDNVTSVIASAPGSYQHFLGCPGDWQPDCLRSWLEDPDGDGVYWFATRLIPAGNYEVKVAINESWNENYGQGGVPNGPNIPFTVPADGTEMFFVYHADTHVLDVTTTSPVNTEPNSVTIAGDLQSELGCAGDWDPACAATHLAFDAADAVWQNTWTVPAGSWQYKAALNDSWDENYGQNATRNGANITFTLGADAAVKFYYDHRTHWVTSNRNAVIATVPGNFQRWLGCPGDWDPGCLRSWLEDPDGDGLYAFATSDIPAGDYEAKVAINESWDENYGAGGVPNGPNIGFTVPKNGTLMTFTYDPVTHVLTISAAGGPRGNLKKARAHWLTRDTFAWTAEGAPAAASYWLNVAPEGGLELTETGVTGGTAIPLAFDAAGLSDALKAKFPYLANLNALKLGADQLGNVAEWLKGQVALSALDANGKLLDATSVQIPGVLDDLYTYEGPLGVSWDAGIPTVRVWAPTAKNVDLVLYADSDPGTNGTGLPMTLDAATGVWSITGAADWKYAYYLFAVDVWVRKTGNVEHNLVTDPYSLTVSTNGTRSQVIDLEDPALKPHGWDALVKPVLRSPKDITLYELHVRDFSANDPSVPDGLKGTFRAFTLPSFGMRHLGLLAEAGLTHVHILPSFDFSSVDEDKSTWQTTGDLSSFPPDGTEQQAAVAAIQDHDAFNWGYDPFHFLTPEGSYATNPDGPARVLEFREMVAGLSRRGLRFVMDSVYNHTSASGQNDKSVLDKVVPGYYHRLNLDGDVETSTCCENTASEHAMMEKLMIDALVMWAREYKVDGFRFDLMGHHMKSNILKAQDVLHSLRLETDGVDGPSIYLYGEGWNFGEVADNARGVNATQINMAGTGVGSFNDRLRDGARGGGPFNPVQEQGFLTGLYLDPNGTDQGSPDDQRALLLLEEDWIRAGLAGGLRDFTFVDRNGNLVRTDEIDYHGQPAGYTENPQELINYVSAHDNETLFDIVQLKAAPDATLADRVRMSNLGVSLVGFSLGIPFFHAGDELLRSKDMDRDSYNSGDWFNRLDFTYQSDNWGTGLPIAGKNQSNWPLMQPLLANPDLKPGPDEILFSVGHMIETLAVRRSSHLFKLVKPDEVLDKVRFHNTGTEQIPGLVVMSLSERTGDLWGTCTPPAKSAVKPVKPFDQLLPDYDFVVVLFNAGKESVTFTDPAFAGIKLYLHPFQASGFDAILKASAFDAKTGTFTIPERTAAVFVCGPGPHAWTVK